MTGFYSSHRTDEKFKSSYGFGGPYLSIRDVCMDFEPCLKVHNLVSVKPALKASNLVKRLFSVFM